MFKAEPVSEKQGNEKLFFFIIITPFAPDGDSGTRPLSHGPVWSGSPEGDV